MKRMKSFKIGLIAFLTLVVLIQFIPVNRENPAVTGGFEDPTNVRQILKRSCYDCHSNETAWPWYASVAPVSWLVAGDVNEARGHLNFSEWGAMQTDDQLIARKEIWKEISKDGMPPGNYLLMHPAAKLSDADKSVIQRWSAVSIPLGDSTENEPDPD